MHHVGSLLGGMRLRQSLPFRGCMEAHREPRRRSARLVQPVEVAQHLLLGPSDPKATSIGQRGSLGKAGHLSLRWWLVFALKWFFFFYVTSKRWFFHRNGGFFMDLSSKWWFCSWICRSGGFYVDLLSKCCFFQVFSSKLCFIP